MPRDLAYKSIDEFGLFTTLTDRCVFLCREPSFNEWVRVTYVNLKTIMTNHRVTEVALDYTATLNDKVILVDATDGAVTITLPLASTAIGTSYYIKKIDSSGNAVTIDGNGSETIDEATTQDITSQYDSARVVSDQTEWWII